MYWKRERIKKMKSFQFQQQSSTKMGAKISKNTDIHICLYKNMCGRNQNK